MTCQEGLFEMLELVGDEEEVGVGRRRRGDGSQEVRAVFFELSFAC
jgi:hypothetical protein